ncbi:hypothetical protein [uncultured Roseobacter sp.]|uniref:hypothetical protein n=1 Tax=uncultured Roseobacter sp. TaxID=114847 RepID=UPI0026188B34|nr:hypothetical protein [uncultured Roseobacter sp.]
MMKYWMTGLFVMGGAMLSGNEAEAASAEFCATPIPALEQTCAIFQDYCTGYLNDPNTLDPETLSAIPASVSSRFAASELTQVTLGYRTTPTPNIAVVYGDQFPSCELLLTDLTFSDLVTAYKSWRATEGADFVATAPFEPLSQRDMPRAYAAVFLAAPREDGRVTEITLNWNLSAAGLTRLKVSYQPEREHTRALFERKTD